MRGSAAPFRWLSLSVLKYECFISRFTIFCLIGRRRPWAAVWILLHTDAVDPVLLSLHVYFSVLPLKSCKHVSHFSPISLSLSDFPFCAVKGQTEFGVHYQVIPVKCLLCLYNWCHSAVLIISYWECVQCCFPPTLHLSLPKKKCFILKISYPWKNGGYEQAWWICFYPATPLIVVCTVILCDTLNSCW